MERIAQCQCGGLRVTVSGEPDRVYVCHCKSCQRRTGAVMHSGAYFLRTQVWPEGDDKVYSRDSDTGRNVRIHFCPNCGSSVWWEGGPSAEQCGVAVGCFADPTFPPPMYSMFEEVKHPWIGLPTSVRDHFDQNRTPGHIPVRSPSVA